MAPRRQSSQPARRRSASDPDATLFEALADAVENVWRKIQLFALGLLHLLFSSDSRWLRTLPPPSAPGASSAAAAHVTSTNVLSDASMSPLLSPELLHGNAKRIIFVRHAESEWNVVFNRGLDWRALVRFARACVREWLMLPTRDSVFIDSPLSGYGVQQARALFADAAGAPAQAQAQTLDVSLDLTDECSSAERAAVLQYLSSPLPHSIVATSNLRRAIATARIASAARLERSGEQLYVLSALQEIGRNIDTLALEDAHTLTASTSMTAAPQWLGKTTEQQLNVAESFGNKSVRGCSRARLHAFARWALRQQDARVLVVYGHSLWFRAFCREYLHGAVHDATRVKLANCGVASFVLEEQLPTAAASSSAALGSVRIVPESFRFIR